MTTEELFSKMRKQRDEWDRKLRTPAPGCPACIAFRPHTREDWGFHPFVHHGYATGKMGGSGAWTHPDLVPKELVKVGK